MQPGLQVSRRPTAINAQDASLALNAATSADEHALGGGVALALAAEGAAPDWVQLLPRGPVVAGVDGRKFYIEDPAAVIAATRPRLPLVIDFEHATEFGDRAATPAAGWIEDLEVRDGSIWGKASWTAKAANMVGAREYRFLSPAIFYRGARGDIVQFSSVGLTHKPNLDLKALNHRAAPHQESSMLKDILSALGLAETATATDALIAINTLKSEKTVALNAAENPSLEKFVPKAQHDETLKALNAATARISERDAADAKARAETLVDDAVKAGKVAPAAKPQFLAMALNSFDATKAAIDAMPAILKSGEQQETKRDPATTGSALDAAEKAVCAALGLTEEKYLATRDANVA